MSSRVASGGSLYIDFWGNDQVDVGVCVESPRYGGEETSSTITAKSRSKSCVLREPIPHALCREDRKTNKNHHLTRCLCGSFSTLCSPRAPALPGPTLLWCRVPSHCALSRSGEGRARPWGSHTVCPGRGSVSVPLRKPCSEDLHSEEGGLGGLRPPPAPVRVFRLISRSRSHSFPIRAPT